MGRGKEGDKGNCFQTNFIEQMIDKDLAEGVL